VAGKTLVPAQGNNVYIFPGVGLGIIACRSRHVTDEMFLVAARTLAQEVFQQDLDRGSVYPPLTRIREVSLMVATKVAEIAYNRGLATRPKPNDLRKYIESLMYEPEYQSYV
jgi:malate dehydrogenase (oxaloacetate-decarboxylating)(NADP+)